MQNRNVYIDEPKRKIQGAYRTVLQDITIQILCLSHYMHIPHTHNRYNLYRILYTSIYCAYRTHFFYFCNLELVIHTSHAHLYTCAYTYTYIYTQNHATHVVHIAHLLYINVAFVKNIM